MNYIASLAGSIITGTAAFMLALGMHIPFLTALLTPANLPSVSLSATSTSAQTTAHTSTNTSTGVSHPLLPNLPAAPTVAGASISGAGTESATSQIGAFTAVVTCTDANPVSIAIKKNGSTVQMIPVQASVTAAACLPARAQDVNFDGVPDIMLATNDGSGGVSFTYWLYNPSTQEFYCPPTSGVSNSCTLMNPTFNPSTKTVTSVDQMSAGSVETKTYKVQSGALVLSSDTTS
jgi:hypothetical protein